MSISDPSHVGRTQRDVFLMAAGPADWRFTLVTRGEGPVRGAVVYVPPWAEEMNRCRRQAAMAAAAFAQDGWVVVQLDLHGTGDSSGDFGDASWASWQEDLSRAVEWAREQLPPGAPVALWSLRAGALLASDWMKAREAPCPSLLWQPVPSGRQALGNFLRLKGAAEMLEGTSARKVSQTLREDLESGRPVDVAGYTVSASLAKGLEEARVDLPGECTEPVALLEVGNVDLGLSPAASSLVEAWSGRGVPCTARRVAGPRFWQTQEVETAPELLPASRAFLAELA